MEPCGKGNMRFTKSAAKVSLLFLGAGISIVGVFLLETSVQDLTQQQFKIQKQIQAHQAVLDRMRDFRRQYVTSMEVVPLMLATAPAAIDHSEGYVAAVLTVQRLGFVLVSACVAADSVSHSEADAVQHCEDIAQRDKILPEDVVPTLKTRADLYHFRTWVMAKAYEYERAFFSGRGDVEKSIDALESRNASLQLEISRQRSWQAIIAVIGIIVALGKDLLGRD